MPCGGGEQNRTRFCVGGEPGHGSCIGPAFQSYYCNGHVSFTLLMGQNF